MRTLILTASAVALSCSFALAQTPPPPGEEPDAGGMEQAPDGTDQEAHGERRGDHEMRGHGPRYHMGRGGPRGPGWHAMRAGPEFTVEIDEDGAVKVEVKCGAREEARGCADITMELLDRVLSN